MPISALLQKKISTYTLLLLIPLLLFNSNSVAGRANQWVDVVSIIPATAPNNSSTAVTIEGNGFTPDTTASLGVTVLSVTYVSATQLTAAVPWGLNPGVYDLKVSDPAQPDPWISPSAFTVTLGLGKWVNNGPFGGQVLDLIFQPGNPDRLYACVGAAGLFVSEDGGASWSMLINNGFPMRLKISPADPEVMYLNTNRSILRSLNRGVSWTEIYPHEAALGGTLVAFPHPSDPATVLISIVPSLNGYNSSNYSTLGPGELWISHDHGDTKTVLADASLTDRSISELVFDPNDSSHQTLLAGTLSGKILLSKNGGVSWTQKHDLSVGVDPSLLPARIDRLVFNPAGGEAWAVKNNPFLMNSWPVFFQASANLAIWTGQLTTSPHGYSLAFGPDKIWAAAGKGYTSPNSGTVNWSPLNPVGVPNETWRDFEFMSFAFAGANTIYGGTVDHGVYKSIDGGQTWAPSNQGLAGIIPYALAVAPDNLDEIYSVSANNGVAKSSDGGQHWTSLNFKRSGYPWVQNSLVVDPSSPNVVYLGNKCPIQGTLYANACMTISRNRGSTWQDVILTAPDTYQMGQVFAIAVNPAHPGWVTAGVTFFPLGWMQHVEHPLGAFYTSTDYGLTWTRSNIDPTLLKGSYIISFDRAGLVGYAGTDGGGLWRSMDGGSTWSSVTWTGCPAATGGTITRVYAVASNPLADGQVFAYCDVYLNEQPVSGGLFRSDNYGADWAAVNMPTTGIAWLQFVNSPLGMALYSGGRAGAARSLDQGITWTNISGLPAADVYAMAGAADPLRSSIYFSTTAGMGTGASDLAGQAFALPSTKLMAGGTYRLTQKLLQPMVFLPLLRRSP